MIYLSEKDLPKKLKSQNFKKLNNSITTRFKKSKIELQNEKEDNWKKKKQLLNLKNNGFRDTKN